jgi:hypothetical protein
MQSRRRKTVQILAEEGRKLAAATTCDSNKLKFLVGSTQGGGLAGVGARMSAFGLFNWNPSYQVPSRGSAKSLVRPQAYCFAAPQPPIPSTFAPTVKIPPGCSVTNTAYLGDGYCDKTGGYNTAICNYDGGDCCVQSCVNAKYVCQNFDCQNPAYEPTPAPTVAPTINLPPGCTIAYPAWLGDGFCDSNTAGFNTPECLFDKGTVA